MASPEKTLLDTLYLHHHIPAADELEREHVDAGLLMRLSNQYPAVLRTRIKKLLHANKS